MITPKSLTQIRGHLMTSDGWVAPYASLSIDQYVRYYLPYLYTSFLYIYALLN